MSDPVTRLNAALEGRYRIDRELGEGGMATVYLADDLRHERKVAVKVLRPELAAVVGAERFLAEIKTTANLQHPHILPLFDSGEANGFLFYVMPYVEGETLREKIDREKQLSVDEALGLAGKVADALDYAHENGVVHRDIKPGNILLSQRGEPLVGDFGIALAVAQAGGGRITETGLSLGTPHYMSPEQATGDRDVDPRSDVYALGCVLYEMLAGEPPFSASTAQAILAKILTMDAPSITMVRRTVPPNVGHALARALEKLPADRFASAAEFRAALTDRGFTYEARTRAATAAVSPPLPVQTVAGGGVDRRLFLATAAVAVLALGLAAWGWLGNPAIHGAGAPVRFTFEEPLSIGGVHPEVAISPDGSFVVYQVPGVGSPELWVRPMDELEGVPLAGAQGEGPVVSPDGQWVAFSPIDDRYQLRRVSVRGGSPVTLTELPEAARVMGVAWTREGEIILGAPGAGLFRIPEGGGDPEPLTTPDPERGETDHLWPSPIGGRRAVVFVVNGGGPPLTNGMLAVLDLETLEVTRLDIRGISPRYVSTGHLLYAAEDGSVRAVPFDRESLTVTGTTVPVIEGVGVKLGGGANFDVSADGRLIYVSGGSNVGLIERSVVWVDRAGREEPVGARPSGYAYARVSPDGGRLALDARDGGIWIWNLASETLTRMILGDGEHYYPVWTPDGERLAYAQFEGSQDLFWKAANNTGEPSVLAEAAGGDGTQPPEPYFFTPDGSAVVLRQQAVPGTDDDLVMWSLAGDSIVWRLGGAYTERNAVLSPDGRWMAYQSNESGTFEVYVRPFPDVGADQVLVSNGGGEDPLWSPDGRRLYYLFAGAPDRLMAVVVDTSRDDARFAFTSREVVMDWPYFQGGEGRNYDISADGERFVAITLGAASEGADAGVHEVTVVLNWFTELRERMGG